MKNSSVPNTAVILAGGKGTRLKSLTDMPKALIKIKGKTLIEYNIELLKKNNVTNIMLALGYKSKEIESYLSHNAKYRGIQFSQEKEPLGTAGPLRLINKPESSFIVTNCDEIKQINIADMFSAHKHNNALATIALVTVNDPWNYGVAKLNGEKITEFIEKPKETNATPALVNAGFYILEPEVIDLIPKGKSMLETDIFTKIAKKGKLYGYISLGEWINAGTPQGLELARKL